MARHRSPQGRRAHLGPPLFALPVAAGVGGAHRSIPLPQLTSSLPARFAAVAVAGGTLAAAGQHALVDALPLAADGANVLRLGVAELLGLAEAPTALGSAAASVGPLVGETLGVVGPVVPEPAVAGAAELVKAAELQRLAVDAAAEQARAAEVARAAELARLTETARAAKVAAEKARAAEATRAAAVKAPAARATPAPARAEAPPAPAAPAAPVRIEPPAPVRIEPPASAVVGGSGVQLVAGRVTSGFGSRGGSQHQGLDIAAPIGTPIRVPLAGTVISSGPASGFGLWVRVRHADGTITVYGHINRALVNVGDEVSAGQVIAEVGNRGQSTGPHLHIEVINPSGVKINPRPWLDARGVRYQ